MRQKVASGRADQSWETRLELVADVEEQTVLLLWSQVIHSSLNTGVSTVASEGQVGTIGSG